MNLEKSQHGEQERLREFYKQALEEEEAARLLRKRKKYEIKLIQKYDRDIINPNKECWFIIDSDWLNQWSEFVNNPDPTTEPPGVMSTKNLFQPREYELTSANLSSLRSSIISSNNPLHDNEYYNDNNENENENSHLLNNNKDDTASVISSKSNRTTRSTRSTASSLYGNHYNPNASTEILPNLRIKIDYRCVSPMVYYIFIELYGRDSSPDICRYTLDIYGSEVPIDRLVSIKLKAVMEAKIQVNKVRPKWINWNLKKSKEEEEEDNDEKAICCFCISKKHIENFIVWMISCWANTTKKNNYKYEKLSNELDDTSHTNVSSISSLSRHSMRSNSSVRSMRSNSSARSVRSNSSVRSVRSNSSVSSRKSNVSAVSRRSLTSDGTAYTRRSMFSEANPLDHPLHVIKRVNQYGEIEERVYDSRENLEDFANFDNFNDENEYYEEDNENDIELNNFQRQPHPYLDDSSSSELDSSDGLDCAPADMNYERGMWFNMMSSSSSNPPPNEINKNVGGEDNGDGPPMSSNASVKSNYSLY